MEEFYSKFLILNQIINTPNNLSSIYCFELEKEEKSINLKNIFIFGKILILFGTIEIKNYLEEKYKIKMKLIDLPEEIDGYYLPAHPNFSKNKKKIKKDKKDIVYNCATELKIFI